MKNGYTTIKNGSTDKKREIMHSMNNIPWPLLVSVLFLHHLSPSVSLAFCIVFIPTKFSSQLNIQTSNFLFFHIFWQLNGQF